MMNRPVGGAVEVWVSAVEDVVFAAGARHAPLIYGPQQLPSTSSSGKQYSSTCLPRSG